MALTATEEPQGTTPAPRYATIHALNQRLAQLGLAAMTTEEARRLGEVERHKLLTALDTADVNTAAKRWLEGVHKDARTPPAATDNGAEPQGSDEDDLPVIAPPRVAQRGAVGVVPQVGRTAPAGAVAGQGGNPAADPSRNPAARSGTVTPIRGQESTTGSAGRAWDDHKAYGKTTALKVECCPTQDRARLTVNLTAAKATDGADCKQGVAWKKEDGSIILSLEPHEIGALLSTLIGKQDTFRTAGHGPKNDKWMEVAQTSGAYAGAVRVTIAQGQNRISVNIGYQDIIQMIGVVERAAIDALKVEPLLTETKLTRLASMYTAGAAAKEARRAT